MDTLFSQDGLSKDGVPAPVQKTADRIFCEFFKKNAEHRKVMGGVEFQAVSIGDDKDRIHLGDVITAEIPDDGSRVTIVHDLTQIGSVIDDTDDRPLIVSMGEVQQMGMVWKAGGENSSIFIVAKNWQESIKIDSNGIVELPEKTRVNLTHHFGRSLGLYDGMKIDLKKTATSFTEPIKFGDIVAYIEEGINVEMGHVVPDMPVKLPMM